MTKFEELMNIIIKSKNKAKTTKKDEGEELDVLGLTEGAGSGQPNMEFATDERDI